MNELHQGSKITTASSAAAAAWAKKNPQKTSRSNAEERLSIQYLANPTHIRNDPNESEKKTEKNRSKFVIKTFIKLHSIQQITLGYELCKQTISVSLSLSIWFQREIGREHGIVGGKQVCRRECLLETRFWRTNHMHHLHTRYTHTHCSTVYRS